MLLGFGHAEPNIGPNSICQAPQPNARHLAADPTHDLTDQMSVGIGVIRVPRAGLPPRIGGRNSTGHTRPIGQIIVGEHLANRGHTSAMTQCVSNGGGLLSAHAKLGPD
ncbi:unannotated protein [freshwater metagenome]|uniref:Unannotated protein n=1 Tax=freshwater metagenome TaxID=449393 RepID=A0A6J6X0P9_9ZZZZ